MVKNILACILFVAMPLAGNASSSAPLGATSKVSKDVHTPEYYSSNARALFKKNQWEQGKSLLDEGIKIYPDASQINELVGQYYYHRKNYDKSRYYLMHAVKADKENVRAKQILVNVEEETHNYSSAICYVNELLEVNPYWKGLWRRKILLFRKQGNDVEADRLLKRIRQIYPNDSTLQREFAGSLENSYLQNRHKNKKAAISSLEEMVSGNMAREEHYMALANLYLQQGEDDKAAEVAGNGATALRSAALAKKKAGIIADKGNYAEAMAYVKRWQAENHNHSLSSFLSGLETDATRQSVQQDPYIMYGRMYERTKSAEALNFLVNTSFARNYNEDALFYINKALKSSGTGKRDNLLYKKYIVCKRMGMKNEAEKLLNQLYQNRPKDTDIREEMVATRLALANERMTTGEYDEALEYLDFVAKNASDNDTREVALRKIYNCYYNTKRYKKALSTLDVINELYPMPTTKDVMKRANTLEQMDDKQAALTLLRHAIDTCTTASKRAELIEAYEETALPWIRDLQQEGATRAAYREVNRLLDIDPNCNQGLRYGVNLAATEHDQATMNEYIQRGRTAYPDDLFFQVKAAEQYAANKQYQEAIDLLQPAIEEYPENQMVRGAFSDNSEQRTLQLMKAHDNDQAMKTIDKALGYDPTNKELLYTKGLVYEAQNNYDSAYVYQKYYEPSLMEVKEVATHLNSLQHRSFANEVTVTYLTSRYTEDEKTSVAGVAYKHKGDKLTLGGEVNYAGRDGDADKSTAEYQITGGMGLQIMPSIEYDYNKRWTFSANAGYATKYFPKWTGNAQATYHFDNDWDLNLGLGYRYIYTYSKQFKFDNYLYTTEVGDQTKDVTAEDYANRPNGWVFDQWEKNGHNMFQLNLGVDKTIDNFWLSAKLQNSLLNKKYYFNCMGQARFFPLEDGITYINAMASVGTAPEASIIDYALPGSFDKLNAMVGLSGQVIITRNTSLGLMGTWLTYYNQNNRRQGSLQDYSESVETSYKNLFTIYVQLHVRF